MKSETYILPKESFSSLLIALQECGYVIYGPKVKDGAIVLGQIEKEADLPVGIQDEQGKGHYRLKSREDGALFGYNLGPHSWKKYMTPPKEKLYTLLRSSSGMHAQAPLPHTEKMAFLAVRACELEAIFIQDRILMQQPHTLASYQERRDNIFIIAINCTRHVSTCFCTTMGCGPRVEEGYDIAMTEVIDGGRHFFTFKIGSEKGEKLSSLLPLQKAFDGDIDQAEALIEDNAKAMKVDFSEETIPLMLKKSWNYKRWADVASVCVSCGNCTMSCPTCFCTTRQTEVSIDGTSEDIFTLWQSCFNDSHSYVHGGSVRTSTLSKYRQWLTHKFGTWWDQFGMSGCVGCGRCIAFCPVGIDVRDELVALQKEEEDEKGC